jgi:hypothetical protein
MAYPSARRRLDFAWAGAAVVAAVVGSYAMWWEAVDYRATSGDGLAMVWAIAPSVLIVMLLAGLAAAVIRHRSVTVAVLSGAVVAAAVLGTAAVFAATERYPTQGAVSSLPWPWDWGP